MNCLEINDEYIQYIKEHPIESKKSALQMTMAIQNSELNAGGRYYTRTLHIPKFFCQEDKRNFQTIVDTFYAIFTRVIEAYLIDPAVRALFPFSNELEELILLEPHYQTPIPICRIDIFYDEETKDFHVCEFNTDGTSAMMENNRLNVLLDQNNVFARDPRSYQIMEIMERWASDFVTIFQQDPNVPERPTIAIVDILENAYLNELYVYQSLFSHRGYQAEVLDLRDLLYEDGKLISKYTHRTIDVVYRRAVTRDIMEHYDEIQPFIQAVKDDHVCLIGAFQTQLIHHKEISKVLVNPVMQKYFTEKQKQFIDAHLPKTYDLRPEIIGKLQEKDRWIIKPKDGFASKGVWAGIDVPAEKWNEILNDAADADYIVQEYIVPYKTENIDLVESDAFRTFSNMTGLYVFAGEFAGVYSRMSDGGIISTQYNERTVPTLFTKD